MGVLKNTLLHVVGKKSDEIASVLLSHILTRDIGHIGQDDYQYRYLMIHQVILKINKQQKMNENLFIQSKLKC